MRLDLFLVEKGYFPTRSKAAAAVKEGKVKVAGRTITKAGTEVDEGSAIEVVKPAIEYVSRGGYKLKGALDHFQVDLTGLTVLDIGASTGGFTDCALQQGAKKVYSYDVGENQLDPKIREDKRVVVKEKINCRYLKKEDLPEPIDFICMDVSFISCIKMFDAISDILSPGKKAVILFKPQFEVGPAFLNSNGIVKNEKEVEKRLEDCRKQAEKLQLKVEGVMPSVIKGTDGNQEYLLYLVKN